MTAVESSLGSRSRLAAHPRLMELVRIAGTLAKAPAEIVVMHDNRASVVASLTRSILQPRPFTGAERDLMSAAGPSHVSTSEGATFAVRDRSGVLVAALTLTSEIAPGSVDALHGVARLISELVHEQAQPSDVLAPETILDGLRDAVLVIGSDFRVLFANRAVGNQFGRTPIELVGTSGIDLLHPDDLDIAFEALSRLAGGREVYRTDLRIVHASGDIYRVEVTGNDYSHDPRIGGMVLSFRSDDRDHELAEELGHERGLLSAVLDQLHDGIVATDRFGTPTLVNQVARLMHGVATDAAARDLTFESFAVLDADGAAVDVADHPVARVVRGERLVDEQMSVVSEGRVRHVRVSGQPVAGTGGAQIGAVVGYQDVTEMLVAERELRDRALHDQLTGLPNRRQLHDHLVGLAERQHDGLVAVCFIDLDGFKLVNDTFGHRAGDAVVRDAARRLLSELAGEHFLARLGGDEFIAVLSDLVFPAQASAVADRIRMVIRTPFTVGDTQVTLTASVGVALSEVGVTGEIDEDTLLRQADIALYAAKARGRNRVELFDAELALAADEEHRQHEMLRNALDRGGLVMHFQPIVDSDNGSTVGFEALARCRLVDGTLVGPDSFLDAANSSGLVWELDRKAFELSCQAAATLRRVNPDRALFMSCNFSALSIVQPAFLQEVMAAVERNGIAPQDFCIEITESTAFEAGEVAMSALRELHALGFVLALDDFGTGYSSLAHLRDLPLSTVKVDRSFVSRLERGTTERAITEAVVHLARTLNLSVVAEGVETIEQVRQVRELGFRFIQGFYYSPARPLSEALLAL
jgi:diguanylate cyclase (GGDEF)-like protein/PAS domain S-box-containing protein